MDAGKKVLPQAGRFLMRAIGLVSLPGVSKITETQIGAMQRDLEKNIRESLNIVLGEVGEVKLRIAEAVKTIKDELRRCRCEGDVDSLVAKSLTILRSMDVMYRSGDALLDEYCSEIKQ